MGLVSEVQLDQWVQLHPREAQTRVVELVWRLVAASVPRALKRSFPLGDAVNQPGPDGILETVLGLPPFVPGGKSLWEVGTGENARDKATKDYKELTAAVPLEERLQNTFVFVTPRSGTSGWGHTWKPDQQQAWQQDRQCRGEWRDVQAVDATQLVDWLSLFPAVDDWLARSIAVAAGNYDTAMHRWENLRTIGDPPPMQASVFLVNREEAQARVNDAVAGDLAWLQLDTHLPDQVGDFVAACVEAMDDETKAAVAGRTIIVEDAGAWRSFVQLRDEHVLVADFDLATEDPHNLRLRESGRRAIHTVILGGPPGGVPTPSRVALQEPRIDQMGDALRGIGYPDERARMLAQKSAGRLHTLLRLLQDLSLLPEWAAGTEASELAIAQLLGGWEEASPADQAVVEAVSGKAYGEWIGAIHECAMHPGTPLRHRDGAWRVSPRYEAWFALGTRVFPDRLTQVRDQSIAVLTQLDPQFELEPDERVMAAVRGKVLAHSGVLRGGLAETLALMGSYPEALTQCPVGSSEASASEAVRQILDGNDWRLWASVERLLPLLAEAAPITLLEAMERALAAAPSPFVELFAQETSGVMGRTYMSGVLWAVETLAWHPRFLTRALLVLGGLAALDPGGNWGNRPAASMRDILLPWHPQTIATIEQRFSAVEAVASEMSDIAWGLLRDLLPESHQMTGGTRRPAWRSYIDEDWSPTVTLADYQAQVEGYLDLALRLADGSVGRLTELIDKLDDIHGSMQNRVLEAFRAEWVRNLSEDEREALWTRLKELVARHRKFSRTEWALPEDVLQAISSVAEQLRPASKSLESRRLFSDRDHDLLDEAEGDYEAQHRKLDEVRRGVMREVLDSEGIDGVLGLAQSSSAPWKVGWALGGLASAEFDALLPEYLDSESDHLRQFEGGYVRSRFSQCGWDWVDGLDMSGWAPSQVSEFFARLPFGSQSWRRAENLLGEDSAEYWRRANANGYESDEDHAEAVGRLGAVGRAWAAVDLLAADLHHERRLDPGLVLLVLKAALSAEPVVQADVYDAIALISALQTDPEASSDEVCGIEWAYLPLLDGYRGDARPLCLHRRLAGDPAFFCETLRLVFRSKNETDEERAELSDDEVRRAQNAYRLLNGWRRVPGTDDDDSLAADAFDDWWNAVLRECDETGHLGVAKSQVGHVIAYSPPDPSGLWIHPAVARLMDRPEMGEMRRGFTLELFNSRGVHTFTAGQAEVELADGYDVKAEDVARAGFHRVAESLRQLADEYRREAKREAQRDPFED